MKFNNEVKSEGHLDQAKVDSALVLYNRDLNPHVYSAKTESTVDPRYNNTVCYQRSGC